MTTSDLLREQPRSEAMTISEERRRAAAEAGWPPELIDRAVRLRLPPSRFDDFLHWTTPVDRVARELDQYEQLTFGRYRQREAAFDDNEKLVELFANSPEEIGDWEITVERGPYAYAQFRLQENVQVQVLEEDGALLSVIARSTRNTYVGGLRLNVRFSCAARTRKDARGRGLSLYVRSNGPAYVPYTNGDYFYIRSQNFAAIQWLSAGSPDRFARQPERADEVPGIPVTVSNVPARPFGGDPTGVRRIEPRDLAVCAGLINRTHHGQDFFRPYTVEFLRKRLDDGGWGPKPEWWTPIYGWEDGWVLEEHGRVVACAGLWDRGRHMRERWRHLTTGEERLLERTALLDFGYAQGREDAMARLVEHLLGETARLERTHLMAPLDQLPALADRLAHLEPAAEAWSLEWEPSRTLPEVRVTRPYTDLVYW